MDSKLIDRARTGDGEAFGELTEPHRRELQVHCYRMLGSLQDAEDALQETLLAAWRSFEGFESRASLRTWLYRIATNRCLNVRRTASRRPAKAWDVPQVQPPTPTRIGEVPWLEPYPDALLDGAPGAPLGPEARYDQRESVSLAFVTALQVLPARQVAVVVLRDVLGFPAADVAEMLDSTVDAVHSALKRGRAGLEREWRSADSRPARDAAAEAETVRRFVQAWEAADLAALVGLLTDDVRMAMPPLPHEYAGRVAVTRLCATLFAAGRRFDLVPTRANAHPAFGAYLRTPDASGEAAGLYVLEVAGDGITSMTRFERTVLTRFDLPERLIRAPRGPRNGSVGSLRPPTSGLGS